jgi:hypothetical protein
MAHMTRLIRWSCAAGEARAFGRAVCTAELRPPEKEFPDNLNHPWRHMIIRQLIDEDSMLNTSEIHSLTDFLRNHKSMSRG